MEQKANHKLYIWLLIASVVIIAVSAHIPTDSSFFTIVSGIGCGGVASVLVAWLIDIATCKRNNSKAKNDQQEIFHDLMQSFETSIQIFIFQCDDFCGEEKAEQREQTWTEWIKEAKNRCISGDDRQELFINAFLTFERCLAEEIKTISVQRAQLLNLGLITNEDSRMISHIGSWCSLVETEYGAKGHTKAFFNGTDMYARILSRFIEESNVLKHINSQKYKSLIQE